MKIFLSVFFVFLSIYSYGQTPDYNTAIETYHSHAYQRAIPLLHLALEVERNSTRIAFLNYALGRSYYENGDYNTALEHYEKAIEEGYGSNALLHRTITLKTLGRYDEALDAAKEYLYTGNDSLFINTFIDGINTALEIEGKPALYTVSPIPEINSQERDYAPSFYIDSTGREYMVFTSTRHSSLKASDDGITGESSSHLYVTYPLNDNDKNGILWSMPTRITIDIPLTDHIGATSFYNDGKTMLYTLCPYNTDDMSCMIAYSTRDKDGKWTSANIIIKNDSIKALGHPSISRDGKILFYTAETQRGDKDIYMCHKIDSTRWSEKVGISTINTTGNEMFPYISSDGKLYFASDGHKGIGALDIFYSEYKNGKFSPPVNMGSPINSSSDDFAMVESHDKDLYFSSSRSNGSGKDDIYIARRIPFLNAIEGKIVDKLTGRALDNVKVRIEGSDGSIHTLYSDAKGHFTASPAIISLDNTYKILLSREKYLVLSLPASTYGISPDEYTLTPDGYLHTTHIIAEMDPMSSPIVLPRIEYDFDKATLRPESKKSLDELITTLEENPDIVIELRAHTDHRGSDEYNDDLSHRRAASCVEYLLSKGIAPHRLHSIGMGRREPFVIPEYFESSFKAGTVLSEDFILSLKDEELDKEARQYNRRTDFKVLGVAVEKREPAPKLVEDENILSSDEENTPTIRYEIDTLKTSSTEEFQNNSTSNEVLFYTLKKGDNYGTVASMFNMTVMEMRNLNGGLKGISPYEGLILKVSLTADYSDYDKNHHRIERTENTLDKILATVGLSLEEFTELNPDFDTQNIISGDIIVTGK